jgi:hypothetical protein
LRRFAAIKAREKGQGGAAEQVEKVRREQGMREPLLASESVIEGGGVFRFQRGISSLSMRLEPRNKREEERGFEAIYSRLGVENRLGFGADLIGRLGRHRVPVELCLELEEEADRWAREVRERRDLTRGARVSVGERG